MDADQDIQSETSLVQMVTSSHQANAPSQGQSISDNARTRVNAVGNLENGKIALVLDFRSAASVVGTVTGTRHPLIVMMQKNLRVANVAVHHQTVIQSQPLDHRLVAYISLFVSSQAHVKAFNITNELEAMVNIKSIFEGVKSRFIVTI